MNENAGLPVDSPDFGVPSCLKLVFNWLVVGKSYWSLFHQTQSTASIFGMGGSTTDETLQCYHCAVSRCDHMCVCNIPRDVKRVIHKGREWESHSIHCPKTVVWDCDIGADNPDIPANKLFSWQGMWLTQPPPCRFLQSLHAVLMLLHVMHVILSCCLHEGIQLPSDHFGDHFMF